MGRVIIDIHFSGIWIQIPIAEHMSANPMELLFCHFIGFPTNQKHDRLVGQTVGQSMAIDMRNAITVHIFRCLIRHTDVGSALRLDRE